MRRIPVDGIADGMVLARSVEDRLGRVLLSKGDALQARFLDRLKDWGITEVFVEGEEGGGTGAGLAAPALSASPEQLEAARVRAEARFSGFDASHPVMHGLKLLAIKHLGSAPGPS